MDLCTIPFDHTHPTAYYSAPNKLLEYFALVKPVITTPVPEIMRTARNFVHVAITADDYTNAIRDYIENKEAYQDLAKKSRKLAEEQTWTRIAEDYEDLLERLLQ
jgi:glycosyltransferase involved in cell wall biosynthesis